MTRSPTAAPLVSVVLPAYNAEATVGAAISSVLWQTCRDVEIVVVDDGSTDRTGEIAAAMPGVATILRQDNRGVAAARNAGVAASRGRFVAFCDADDLLLEGHLQALLDTWHSAAAGGVATANAYWLLPGGIDPRKTRHRGRFPAYHEQRITLLQYNFVSIMCLLPRSLFDGVGGFDESLRQAEDWEFWLRVAFAGHRIAHQPRPLALYRWSTTGLSSQVESFHRAEHDVLRRVAQWPQLTPGERELVARRLAAPVPRALLASADDALASGRYVEAARTYRRAASLVPGERPLRAKARLMSLAPFLAGPLLRARARRTNERLGIDERFTR